MEYQQAIEKYVNALADIAITLNIHHEARTEFEPGFLIRTIHDGFLQPTTEDDRQRLLYDHTSDESFLLWYGELLQQKMHWNCIGWILPFRTSTEMERSYELVTRAEIAQKSWANVRQFLLSCRKKFFETPFHIPTNLVKVRVKGAECRAALRMLEKSPPNLRYVTKAVVDRLSSTNYFRRRTQIKIVVGERLQPYVRTPR